ncbi:hypothetical protein FIBSPDRAFT_866408, partial [Athelia psychrophila]
PLTISAGAHDIGDGVFRRMVSPERERDICPMRPPPCSKAEVFEKRPGYKNDGT